MTDSTIVTSEKSLMDSLHRLSSAGGSIIQLRTREPMRAALALRRSYVGSDTPYHEWISSSGTRRFTKENLADFVAPGQEAMFYDQFMKPLEALRDHTSAVAKDADKIHYFAYVNAHHWIGDNPVLTDLIAEYAALLPSTNVCILLITNDQPLRGVAHGDVLVTDFATPTADELRERVISLVEEAINADERLFPQGSLVSEEDYDAIAAMGLGMTHAEFESYTALALVEASERRDEAITAAMLLDGVARGKTAVVRQSEILELSQPQPIENVGGMHRLKDWLIARRSAFTQEARDFGVRTPKGCTLVGVPGSGKSLVAKACSSIFNVPLIKLDFARVFSKFVGDSESRVRSALHMVESMAPCVLFVDEIDKGLGGIGSGGDSGTSMRVLGSFLTWLQEHKSQVFTVCTANRVEGLPPELLRRGRFDQVFSVSLPDADARREILAIHLRLAGRDIDNFEDIDAFLAATEGFVAAEIESIVGDGIVNAFNDETAEELETRHLIAAAQELVPMSVSNKAQIDAIVAWAASNALSVEYPERKATAKANGAPARTRNIRTLRQPR